MHFSLFLSSYTQRYFCLPFFFFNDTATTEIYTLSLHDALPICRAATGSPPRRRTSGLSRCRNPADRKSTRLNSSHVEMSYAVFCLKKKSSTVKLSVLEQTKTDNPKHAERTNNV